MSLDYFTFLFPFLLFAPLPGQHKLWCQSSGQQLLATLKQWKSDLNEIPRIHRNVDLLSRRLLGADETAKDGASQTKQLLTMTGSSVTRLNLVMNMIG